MCLTRFGDDSTGPSALFCTRNDALIDNSAASPKPCLSPRDAHTKSRRWLTPRRHSLNSEEDDLSLTDLFLEPRRVQETYQPDKLQACPLLAEVIQTKSRQTLIFDPGDSTGRLRAYPFSKTWRALLCGEILVWERLVAIWNIFWQDEDLGIPFFGVRYKQIVPIAVHHCFVHSQAGLNMPCRSMRAGGGERMSENVMERGD